MPALFDFQTIPQLYRGLVARSASQTNAVFSYKDRETKAWTGISWSEAQDTIESIAAWLIDQGIAPGDRVAIISENRPEWAFMDMATQIVGAVNVSLYTSLPADQVAYILNDSGSRILLASTGLQIKKARAIFDGCAQLSTVVGMQDVDDTPTWLHGWNDVVAAGSAVRATHQAEINRRSESITPADLSALIYTSGTTGNPKGVMLTHENFCSNAVSALSNVPFGPGDVHLSFLPLCHSFERTAGYTAILAAGGQIVYAESVDAVSRNMGEVAPTGMISVPRLFERIYNLIAKSVEEGPGSKRKIFNWAIATGKARAQVIAQEKTPSALLNLKFRLAHKLVFEKLHQRLGGRLRFAVSGGAALPKAIGEFFQATGITIIEGYGLTETAPVLTINPMHAPRYGQVGHVIAGVTVGIMDIESGQIKGMLSGAEYPSSLSTEPGEIVAKGPNIMKGYWNNERATAESIDAQGWYHTGDVGRFVDGYLQITDRIKHMIVNKGGKNIYPGPIEELFKTTPGIDQVMVIGEGREFLTALVVPDTDFIRTLAGADESVERADLLTNEAVLANFRKVFKDYSRTAASHEKIRDCRLVDEAFSVDNGQMTPTLKLRRRQIEEAYADLIETMYESVV